jgi:putative transposase
MGNKPHGRARVNKTTGQYRVSDELWAVLAPLIPVHVNVHRFGGGRPRVADRTCADGIFFVLRTGCQWKALDATGICSGSTAHSRFQEWVQAGVFEKLWQAGLEQFDDTQGLDWRWLSMDGAMTKAPLGGGKNRAQSDGSSQIRGETQHVDGSAWDSGGHGRQRRELSRYALGAGHP